MKRQFKDLSQFEFATSDKKVLTLKEFFTEEDYWTKEGFKVIDGKRTKVPVAIYLKHQALERLAHEAGISLEKVDVLVTPQASNEQEHLFLGHFRGGYSIIRTITKDAKGKSKTETTFEEKKSTSLEVGEASTRNTSLGVARSFMGSMAFKRLFDRGVLTHLGFFELYAEGETEEFDEGEAKARMSPDDFQGIKEFLDKFSMASSIADLDKAKNEAVKVKDQLNQAQRKYLSESYKKCLVDLQFAAEPKTEGTPNSEAKPVEPKPDVPQAPATPDPLAEATANANASLEKEAQKSEAKVSGEEVVL